MSVVTRRNGDGDQVYLRRLRTVLAGIAVLAAGACAATPAAIASPIAPSERVLVSLGDSYAAGYQPGGTTESGFAYRLAAAAGLQLVNFGCSGITSHGLLAYPGCDPAALGPGAPDYSGVTQAAAAQQFLAAHRGQVAAVTVIIGGNDVQPCLFTEAKTLRPDAVPCLQNAIGQLRGNLATLLEGLRRAAPGVRIIGLTYPDIWLGAWTRGTPDGRTIAVDSVTLFRDGLNPALRATYAAAGATFVDVTTASAAYQPLNDTVADPAWGTVPASVARVCALTFFCSRGDVHPTDAGYAFIAETARKAVTS